jgi:hypothetical protein
MEVEVILLISQILMTLGMLVITIYRVKLEKKSVQVIVGNTEAIERIRALKWALKSEREQILSMTGKDFIDFLEKVIMDAD